MQLAQASLWANWSYAGVTGASVLCIGMLRRRHSTIQRTLEWLVWSALSFSIAGLHAVSLELPGLAMGEKRDVEIEGVIAAWPRSFERGPSFELQVERWRVPSASGATGADPPWHPSRGSVRLAWYQNQAERVPVAGERWRFHARLRAPRGYANPGGRDSELWDWRSQVWAVGYVRDWQGESAMRLAGQDAWRWISWRQ